MTTAAVDVAQRLFLDMQALMDRSALGYPKGEVYVPNDQVLQDVLGGYFYNSHGLGSATADATTIAAAFLGAFQSAVSGHHGPKLLVWRITPYFSGHNGQVRLYMRLRTNFPFLAFIKAEGTTFPLLTP